MHFNDRSLYLDGMIFCEALANCSYTVALCHGVHESWLPARSFAGLKAICYSCCCCVQAFGKRSIIELHLIRFVTIIKFNAKLPFVSIQAIVPVVELFIEYSRL
jgi:hypothetical protein